MGKKVVTALGSLSVRLRSTHPLCKSLSVIGQSHCQLRGNATMRRLHMYHIEKIAIEARRCQSVDA
jgi:hypothetical protein